MRNPTPALLTYISAGRAEGLSDKVGESAGRIVLFAFVKFGDSTIRTREAPARPPRSSRSMRAGGSRCRRRTDDSSIRRSAWRATALRCASRATRRSSISPLSPKTERLSSRNGGEHWTRCSRRLGGPFSIRPTPGPGLGQHALRITVQRVGEKLVVRESVTLPNGRTVDWTNFSDPRSLPRPCRHLVR